MDFLFKNEKTSISYCLITGLRVTNLILCETDFLESDAIPYIY